MPHRSIEKNTRRDFCPTVLRKLDSVSILSFPHLPVRDCLHARRKLPSPGMLFPLLFCPVRQYTQRGVSLPDVSGLSIEGYYFQAGTDVRVPTNEMSLTG